MFVGMLPPVNSTVQITSKHRSGIRRARTVTRGLPAAPCPYCTLINTEELAEAVLDCGCEVGLAALAREPGFAGCRTRRRAALRVSIQRGERRPDPDVRRGTRE
jgi:hypothetical protein